MTSDLRSLSLHLAECTDLEAESFRGAVALLPCGALAGYGPHLPISTATLVARAAAERAAERLDEEDWAAVVLPSVTFGASGAFRLSPETATAMVRDLCLATRHAGLGGVVLCCVEREPEQSACLHKAAELARDLGVEVVFPDLTRVPYALALGLEARGGGRRGGRFDTSLMLAVRPAEVRSRMTTGSAGAATVEEGRLLLDEIAGIFVTAAVDLLEGGRTRRGVSLAAR